MHRLLIAVLLIALATLAAPYRPAVAAGSIGGLVWDDANIDGIRQPEERALSGVTVRLNPSQRETTTDLNGIYRFEGLVPDHYSIIVYTNGDYIFGTYPFRTVRSPFNRGAEVGEDTDGRYDFGVTRPAAIQQGVAWINGDQAKRPLVMSFSNEVQCRFPADGYLFPPHSADGAFVIAYPPAGYTNGCAEGSTITYTVNLQPANETSVLEPPNMQRGSAPFPQPGPQHLTVGPAFAVYVGDFIVPDGYYLDGIDRVRVLVNGNDCGIGQPSQSGFYFSVLPASLRPGCASEGSTVEFWLAMSNCRRPNDGRRASMTT